MQTVLSQLCEWHICAIISSVYSEEKLLELLFFSASKQWNFSATCYILFSHDVNAGGEE